MSDSKKEFPFPLGTVETGSFCAGLLGQLYEKDNKVYRLCQADNAITDPENKVVVTAYSAGVPTYVVDVTTTLGDVDVAGVIPNDYNAINLAADDYFYVQVTGPCQVLAQATTITEGAPLHAGSVAGTAQEIITGAEAKSAVKAYFAYATNTAAATAASLAITAMLDGLL